MFLYLKLLGGRSHDNNDGIKTTLLNRLSYQAADFYEVGIQKQVVRYNKCFNISGNYVDKEIKLPASMYK